MANDISLTIRLPHEINENLKIEAKRLGFTRTSLIRIAIHELFAKGKITLDFSQKYSADKDRLVLNINQLTNDILHNTCEQYGQAMNSVVTAICAAALKYCSKWQ